jgi:hypothetical protein
MLGLANSPNTSCNVDDAIPAAVSAASALVGDRVVYPIGSSLCPCCGSKKGCSTGTCSAADGGDCNPVPAADVTPHTSVLGPWNAAGNCSLNVTPSVDNDMQGCVFRNYGLWTGKPNAEMSYASGSNTFTLTYLGVQLADLATAADSGGALWPRIRAEYNRSCGCCNLCRAQPNAQAAMSANKCRAWAYRPSDRACRLWSSTESASGLILDSSGASSAWYSGLADKKPFSGPITPCPNDAIYPPPPQPPPSQAQITTGCARPGMPPRLPR